jgi:crotonobetainyl-CoA:carnitine CoA-transferase CaiB-like acyl-CoA transferase
LPKLRVLDLTSQAGVYAGRLLAEQGHEVIRIESPHGDALRRLGPYLGDGSAGIEDGAYHQFFNAGKRSLALDLASNDGREAFARLARTAQVVLMSEPYPLAPEAVRALNPAMVLTILTGESWPELGAYARAGLLSITGHPDATPVLMGGHIIYAATGLWVMVATATAMLVQQLSGRGQLVTVDIQQCFETFLDMGVENFTGRDRPTERRGHRGAVTPISGAFPSGDGYWMLSLGDTNDRWHTLMEWMQDPVLANDPVLEDYDARQARRDAILDRIGAWAEQFRKIELVTQAQARHIPAAPVATTLELADDPQLIDRGFLVETEHPRYGALQFPRGALATLWDRAVGFAPRLGEANAELLGALGYSPAEQTLLFERGES